MSCDINSHVLTGGNPCFNKEIHVLLYEGYSGSSWNLVVKCSNIFIILSFFEISEVDIYELVSGS